MKNFKQPVVFLAFCKKLVAFSLVLALLGACSSTPKTYQNDVFPKGDDWKPINPEWFGVLEAQRMQLGKQ